MIGFTEHVCRELEKGFKELRKHPERILPILIKAGICDKNGNLTKEYK